MLLGVNIDHIAVLREARKINDPDPLDAVALAVRAGADQITIHLREDRRHINEHDAKRIIEHSPIPVNLECSVNPDIVEIVAELKPHRATFVPENRDEVTTEGGLNFETQYANLDKSVHYLKAREIETAFFIDPTKEAIQAARGIGVKWVELHTGTYANIFAMLHSNLRHTPHCIEELDLERSKLVKMLKASLATLDEISESAAEDCGLKVAAGHGLNYQNVKAIAAMQHIQELNIGQSIVARSVFSGFSSAVEEMVKLVK